VRSHAAPDCLFNAQSDKLTHVSKGKAPRSEHVTTTAFQAPTDTTTGEDTCWECSAVRPWWELVPAPDLATVAVDGFVNATRCAVRCIDLDLYMADDPDGGTAWTVGLCAACHDKWTTGAGDLNAFYHRWLRNH
jgi:hypothetical protein